MHLSRRLDAAPLPATALAALSLPCPKRPCGHGASLKSSSKTRTNTGERRRDFGAVGAAPSAPAGASAHVAAESPGADDVETVPRLFVLAVNAGPAQAVPKPSADKDRHSAAVELA